MTSLFQISLLIILALCANASLASLLWEKHNYIHFVLNVGYINNCVILSFQARKIFTLGAPHTDRTHTSERCEATCSTWHHVCQCISNFEITAV